MNLSMKWLADYTDVSDITIKEYCDRMTMSGSKVEGYEELGADISGVISSTFNVNSTSVPVCLALKVFIFRLS